MLASEKAHKANQTCDKAGLPAGFASA